MEGIFFEREAPGKPFVRTDNWPGNKTRAQIKYDNQGPFGNYSKANALSIIEEAISKGQVKYNLYAVVPGTEQTPEQKRRLEDLRQAKQRREAALAVDDSSDEETPDIEDLGLVGASDIPYRSVEGAYQAGEILFVGDEDIPCAPRPGVESKSVQKRKAAQQPKRVAKAEGNQTGLQGDAYTAEVVRRYKDGEKVKDIAVAMGAKPGQGQNRCRTALKAAGVYKP